MWEGNGSSGRTGSGRKRLREICLSACGAWLREGEGQQIAWLLAGVGATGCLCSPATASHFPGCPWAASAAIPLELPFTQLRSADSLLKQRSHWNKSVQPVVRLNSGPPRENIRRCPLPCVNWKQLSLLGKMTASGGGNTYGILGTLGFL